MTGNRSPPTSLEEQIGRVLRGGVIVATLLILTGVVAWFAVRPERAAGPYRAMEETLGGFQWVSGLVRGDGDSLVMLGLWVLVLTPWLRVISSLVFFWRTGDRVFVALTALVGLLMIAAWVLGNAQG